MAPVIVRPVRKRVQARKISIIQPNQGMVYHVHMYVLS